MTGGRPAPPDVSIHALESNDRVLGRSRLWVPLRRLDRQAVKWRASRVAFPRHGSRIFAVDAKASIANETFRRRQGRVALLVIGALVAVVVPSGVALAGKRVVSGQQTLLIKARLSPSTAGARNVTFGFHYEYRSTRGRQQPPYNMKTITLVMPRGLVVNPAAAPACKQSQINKAMGDLSKCPRNTIIGRGSVVANARPTVPRLITGTATVYNVVNDVGRGQPKGARDLILWVKTSDGGVQEFPFQAMRSPDGRAKLVARLPKPAQPGVMHGTVTVQRLDLSVSGSVMGSFNTNPTRCSGSWRFVLKIVNYFNQPPITAYDRVRCKP